MVLLRPPAPPDSDRCSKSTGPRRCKSLRIRGKPFCRKHLPLSPSPKKKTKKKRRPGNISRVKVRVSLPTPSPPSMTETDSPRPGQVWVVPYQSDGLPALPRAYARIERILESTVEITPLEFRPVTREDYWWVEKKLPISCGTFRAQKPVIVKERSHLCHRIGFEKEGKDYKIFPRKGEVWAIYKECDGSETSALFRLVEILIGFTEEGVLAAGLVAEMGSNGECILRRDKGEGFDLVRLFSRRELVLFSHRIPDVKVVGRDHYGDLGEELKMSFK